MPHSDPGYRPCNDCTEYVLIAPTAVGDLLSRHFEFRPIGDVVYDALDQKAGSPDGWLAHVTASIVGDGVIRDPLGLASTSHGLEIINGNHRSWIAYQAQLPCPALIFTPRCGVCTEALFLDSINSWTRAIGWMYHQQGFEVMRSTWMSDI